MCVFCEIASGRISAEVLYEDELVMAFKDANPVAEHHVIVIPKKHISSLLDINETFEALYDRIFKEIYRLANDLGLSESGFRVVNNFGADGGQTVPHLHFHLMGGREFGWPPG